MFGPSLIAWLPRRTQGPLGAILDDTRRVFLHPPTCVRTAGLSLVVHLMSVGIVWILSLAVATPIAPVTLLVLVPPMLFATMLPFTVSGWGAREGAVVWFLSAHGTPPEGPSCCRCRSARRCWSPRCPARLPGSVWCGRRS